jgi:hypothetical protein
MLRELTYSSIRIGMSYVLVRVWMWCSMRSRVLATGAYEPIRNAFSGNADSKANPLVKWLAALLSGGSGATLANPTGTCAP